MKCAGFLAALAVALAVAIASLSGPGAALAQADADPKAAAEPVLRQLEAFRSDDYDTAYTFASDAIRGLFDRPAFEQMVKRGYPEIARSAAAHVAESRIGPDGHVYVRLKIRGANGRSIEAVYDMVWEGGRFRINGVAAKPDPGLV